ncbi:hypothetical protein C4D60_Mb04t12140 [Musa balbisiana]|uniref:Uncharacterized protein n=1 Tax=Musa balbisiana TaxID=52838 RepID=A0A4S8KBJ9_MUSBA|nr:hypothetical protein C4D60_Mb04t12140 [Musa balbisiana]
METFLFAAAGDGTDSAVDAASGSLGAGRERRDPSADEPLPALHQLNRRRKATTFSFFRGSRSRMSVGSQKVYNKTTWLDQVH